jgi:outer membrane protein TolC
MKLRFAFLLLVIAAKSFSQQKDLHYFIEKAKSNSPLLIDYQNQIESATLDSLLNRAAYGTQISANINGYYAPVINGYGYDPVLSNNQSISGLVGFNKKIIGGNRLKSQSDSYRLIKNALSVNKKIAAKDLEKAITAQYITAWGTSVQLEYNRKISDLLKEEDDILRQLTRNSVYRQTDYLTFDASVKQQQFVSLQLKQQYTNDVNLLNYLVGERDTAVVALKSPEVSLKTLQDESRLFLKQFEADSLKVDNSNIILDNNYKPSLTLTGDAGYNSSFAYQAYRNFGISMGVALNIPIYDGHQRQFQHKKNDLALQTIRAYKANFKRQYDQQLAILSNKLKQASENSAALKTQLSVYQALIDANSKLLRTGDAQITEYVLAVSSLVSLQTQLAQNNVDELQLINEINYWKTNE